MEEFIIKLFDLLPNYFTNFSKLLLSPRQFPADKVQEGDGDMKKNITGALLFFGISYAIVIAFRLLRISGTEPIITELASLFVGLVSLAFVIFITWKIFGSKRPFHEYFTIYTYHFSGVLIIYEFFEHISDGFLKASSNKLVYQNIMKKYADTPKLDLIFSDTSNLQITAGILYLGVLLLLIWFLIGWGSYRIINNGKRSKSFLVLLVALVFSFIMLMVFSLFMIDSNNTTL